MPAMQTMHRESNLARRLIGSAAAFALALILCGCAGDASTVPVKVSMAGIYTTLAGNEVYVFRGPAGEAPQGGNWAPLIAKSDDVGGRDFRVVERRDGSLQWAFRGELAYYYRGEDSGRRRDPEIAAGRMKPAVYPYGAGAMGGSGGR